MSNTKQSKKNSSDQKNGELDAVIETIKSAVSVKDMLVLVGTDSPEVSGVVEDTDGLFRDVMPLGDGVHIVLSVGNLGSALGSGIHELGQTEG